MKILLKTVSFVIHCLILPKRSLYESCMKSHGQPALQSQGSVCLSPLEQAGVAMKVAICKARFASEIVPTHKNGTRLH
jgi:hypothetical protein